MGRLQGPQFRPVSLEETASNLQNLANIDARVLGVSREKHHRYLLNDRTTRGVALFRRRLRRLRVCQHRRPHRTARRRAARRAGSAFRTALALAVEIGSPQVSAFLPGASEAALRTAVEHGMRITFPMLLMSTRDFGDWTGYLPRNPGFM